MISESKVEGKLYTLLHEARLAEQLGGKLYRAGIRPRESQEPGVIVRHVAGLPGSVDVGTALIAVYIPDIVTSHEAQPVKDIQSCIEAEEQLLRWLINLNTAESHPFLFKPAAAIITEAVPERREHAVVLKLRYYHFSKQ